MTTAPNPATSNNDRTPHGRRVIVAWLILTVITAPLVGIFVGPLLPPGNGSLQGSGQVFDNQVMTAICMPILCLLAVFFAYVLVQFRARRNEAIVDGPPLRHDTQVQVAWMITTLTIVLFLAGFGTYELLKDGSGGGQGPNPIALPGHSNQAFQVQVIGQQWQFTYRYPSLGGMESNELVLPANTDVALHVTSLDVIHSFWAYELGVKADANPGVDNVAYVQTKGPMTFHVRCAELCGLWHGYMYDNGKVVSAKAFQSWAAGQKKIYAAIAPYMNKAPGDGGAPYSHSYLPAPGGGSPQVRAG